MQDTALLIEVCRALSLNQRGLAEFLGLSTRTVQRIFGGRSAPPSAGAWQALARATHGGNPDLAARAARQGGSSLVALGLVAQPAPPLPAPSPVAPGLRYDVRHLTDGVVCSAAEAIDVTPGAIRPALLAAVRRARQMGLTLDDLEASLGEGKPRRGRDAATGPR